MDNQLRRVALSIRFKEYLLGRDVSSRRILLKTAMSYAEKSNNEKKGEVIEWLNNVLRINKHLETAEVAYYDVLWDELHTELIKSTLMYEIMYWFVGQA